MSQYVSDICLSWDKGKLKILKCHQNLFLHSAHPSETVFLHSSCWKSPSLLLKIFSKSHFFNWTQTKLVLSPVKCALSWADTKMSNQYFLFIFLCYEKQKLISEKFETNFVKQFLPWNPTPCKPSSTL